MTVLQGVCNSFKQEILEGLHDLTLDTLKIALYTDGVSLSPATTAYSATNEATGSGYTAGGETVANVSLSLASGIVSVNFDDVEWLNVSFTDVVAALLYNDDSANRAIAVYDLGGPRTATNDIFILRDANPDTGFSTLRIR